METISDSFSPIVADRRRSIGVAIPHVELTVIIPVFNEAMTIVDVLERVACESTPKEVIIVDDGSTDRTSECIGEWIRDRSSRHSERVTRIHSLKHPVNRGKGAAIRTALPLAQAEFIVVQDADLEVSPDEYPALLAPLVSQAADFVVGYRKHGSTRSRRFAHILGIQLLNLIVRTLYGVTVRDEACCFKVLRTSDLRRMQLECNRFEYCPEVISKAARLGLRFAEVPVDYWPRDCTGGKKLRLTDGFQAIGTLWKFRRWRGA